MPINRIQFQPGLSLAEFLKDHGTEAQCEPILERRAGTRVSCPECGKAGRPASGEDGRRSSSAGCRKQVS